MEKNVFTTDIGSKKMNLKLSKALRKMSKEVMMRVEGSTVERRQYQHRKTGTIINDPKSLRGIYRRLKRELTR